MGTIHKFKGKFGELDWQDIATKKYSNDRAKDVIKKVLIGAEDGARHFEIRYFEIAPGGHSSFDQHAHDHGVVVLRGKGRVLLGKQKHDIGFGDAIYIAPLEEHQFENTGNEPLGFICVSPPKN